MAAMKTPLNFIRVHKMELRSYCPTKKSKRLGGKFSGSKHCCPSCLLPFVVAFIFIFTVSQLIVIHRTIGAYKQRHQAFKDCYFSTNTHNDSRTLADLTIAQNFLPSFPLESLESLTGKGDQSYPYNLHRKIFFAQNWRPKCAENPKELRGNMSHDFYKAASFDTISNENSQVILGGKWQPEDCMARFNIAIIIPFRDRWKHLKSLLRVLHPMLQRQKLAYRIFVVEQFEKYTFNKGSIMNAAFLLAMNISMSNFDCVIFHDVDLIPEDDRNSYTCASKAPRHLSVAIDALDYRLPYKSLVGGVFSIRVEDFVQVNGYSNLFWGWGGEDDDMSRRLTASHLQISRPNPSIGRYRMLFHGSRLGNKFLAPLIRTSRIRFPKDGLTTCKFRLVKETQEKLYTHFLIDPGLPAYVLHNKTLNPHVDA